MRRARLALLFGAVLLSGAAHATASEGRAPILLGSNPSDGDTVHQAPARVEMTFSEPLDNSSRIEVRDECNRRVDSGTTSVQLNEMSVTIDHKPSGVYVASYSATGLGGVTGTTTGSISFTVHMGSACDGSVSGGGHGGHGDGGGGGGGGGGQHEGHQDDDDHSGSGTHSTGGHRSGSSTHAAGTHAAAGGGDGHGKHSKGGKGKGKHGRHGRHGRNGSRGQPTTELAAPGDLVPAPDGNTLLVALGASILLGAGGGLLVRVGVHL